MQYELNQQELNIIQKALKDLLEVGITEPQENYIRNIDAGLSKNDASKIYANENKEFWKRMIEVEKNQIYILYNRLFEPLL
tara:strand:- start:1908 stop:2150 length:243 start_codon:yes stop_codon:yes gene_type:complete